MVEEHDDRRQTVVQKPNNLQYVVAAVAVEAVAIIGVAAVATLHAGDNTAVIAAIIGLAQPTALSLLAFMKAQETHLSVNSRLDAFMSNAKLASRAQGLMDGRREGRDDANQRTDHLASASAPSVMPSTQPVSADIPRVEAPVIVVAPKP